MSLIMYLLAICLNKNLSLEFLIFSLDVYNEGGIGGFWKGLRYSLILIINPIINFSVYDYL